MRTHPAAFCLLLVLPLAGCDRAGSTVALQIGGDSLAPVATVVLPDGQESVFCRYGFTARLQGGPGDSARIRQGRVTFSFLDTGLEHMTLEWPPEQLATVWEDPTIAAGDTVTSHHQDIGFSQPFRPVRGSAVFDYSIGADDAVLSTEPHVFTCR